MEFTKEKAIEEHRKMWNWIADQFESGVKDTAFNLKAEYCRSHFKGIDINNYCFCCEYAENVNIKVTENNYEECKFCPLVWGTEDELSDYYCENHWDSPFIKGLWTMVSETSNSASADYKRAAKIAREIANLPKRPNKSFDILKESEE